MEELAKAEIEAVARVLDVGVYSSETCHALAERCHAAAAKTREEAGWFLVRMVDCEREPFVIGDEFAAQCKRLCEAERDRLTSAEVCIDEVLTTLDRHGMDQSDFVYRALASLSGTMHRALTAADGLQERRERLIRVRKALNEALPLSDADLAEG
jgi:hypothetical protein